MRRGAAGHAGSHTPCSECARRYAGNAGYFLKNKTIMSILKVPKQSINVVEQSSLHCTGYEGEGDGVEAVCGAVPVPAHLQYTGLVTERIHIHSIFVCFIGEAVSWLPD